MTSEMINLLTTESIIMRDRKIVTDKIDELKRINPWYPTNDLAGKLSGYNIKLKNIRAKKKEFALKGM